MSREFEAANRQVCFFLNDLGGVQIGSWHPRKTTVGALGIDSRTLTMLSKIDQDIYFTLERELSDSIVQAILKTGDVLDDRLVGQTPIVELFQLMTAFPAFDKKYPTLNDIPLDYLNEARHIVPVHFYSQEQKIRSIGPEELNELEKGLLEIAIPIEIDPLPCEQEFELNGKLMPYSFEIPGISGVVYIIVEQEKFLGKKIEFNNSTLTIPGLPGATLSSEHLARLCLMGQTEFDFTAGKGE